MAEPKGGLLAIIGGGKPGDSEKSEKSGASSAKARALESMWSAMESGDFDEAAEHFQEAYDECAMHSAESGEESDEEDFDLEEN
jgi:hypothetical protein